MRENSLLTWEDAARQWIKETQHKRTHVEDVAKLKWIGEHWRGILLSDVSRDAIRLLADRKGIDASSATVNRYLALIRAILRRAWREWEWLDRVPHVRLLPELKRRIRWLPPDSARHLLEELPDHLRDAVLFALATGLRHSNVAGLKWDQVDLRRRVAWVYADQTKNGEDLSISLNDVAMEVLRRRKGMHSRYVFTYRGRPVARLNSTAFGNALKRAGIENFRWHDLRHTWASWLVQEGVPLFALQEMGGWKTAAMVRRYAHLSPAHNLRYAQTIDAIMAPLSPDRPG